MGRRMSTASTGTRRRRLALAPSLPLPLGTGRAFSLPFHISTALVRAVGSSACCADGSVANPSLSAAHHPPLGYVNHIFFGVFGANGSLLRLWRYRTTAGSWCPRGGHSSGDTFCRCTLTISAVACSAQSSAVPPALSYDRRLLHALLWPHRLFLRTSTIPTSACPAQSAIWWSDAPTAAAFLARKFHHALLRALSTGFRLPTSVSIRHSRDSPVLATPLPDHISCRVRPDGKRATRVD